MRSTPRTPRSPPAAPTSRSASSPSRPTAGSSPRPGFWQRTEGTLLITVGEDEVVGHIEFFRPIVYWDAFELSYQLYGDRHAGHGYVTEAVAPGRLPVREQEGAPHPAGDRAGERRLRRIAEKCGFVLEGTARGAFFNDGRNHDVLLYSLLRTDPRPWRAADGG